jgi:hypothetical protein
MLIVSGSTYPKSRASNGLGVLFGRLTLANGRKPIEGIGQLSNLSDALLCLSKTDCRALFPGVIRPNSA